MHVHIEDTCMRVQEHALYTHTYMHTCTFHVPRQRPPRIPPRSGCLRSQRLTQQAACPHKCQPSISIHWQRWQLSNRQLPAAAASSRQRLSTSHPLGRCRTGFREGWFDQGFVLGFEGFVAR